jgi:Flp pilus assembly CpaF family ATPase
LDKDVDAFLQFIAAERMNVIVSGGTSTGNVEAPLGGASVIRC